jgi:uncharacterized membrane protein HdeD (DUF308 family)
MNTIRGQSRWFRFCVGVLTLISGIALFSVSGLGIHSLASVVIAFLCLLGLERLYSGLLGLAMVLLQARRAKANRDAS